MANMRMLGIDQITGQGRFLESTDAALNVVGGAAVRVLVNQGGSNYAQTYLQGLYDGQPGLPAPDTVPQAIADYANTLNSGGYKVYLGLNSWWYTNATTGITTTNWTLFGGGGKSAFGANIVASGILTYK